MEASRARPGAWRTVWVLTFVYAMAIVDRMALLLLIPGIKASLNLTDTQISLLHGLAFAVCFSVAGLFLGYLVDRSNRRNLLAASVLGWSLATMACGLAQDFATFFAARMAVGFFQAAMAPAAISMIADLFPAERRGKPTGLLLSAGMFGGALGNFGIGGLLAWFGSHRISNIPLIGHAEPWQLALIVAGAVTLIAVPMFAMVAEPERETRRDTDTEPQRFAVLAHVRAHAALFAMLFAFFIVQAVVLNGIGNWWPAVFMRSAGMSPVQTGLLLGANSIVTGIGVALIAGWLGDRAARRDGAAGRLKLAAICIGLTSLTLLPLLAPHSVVGLMLTLTVNVILLGTVATAVFAILPELVPPQGRGLMVATYQFVTNLIGFGAGPTLVALVTNGILQDENRIADAMMLFGFPLLALAVVLALLSVPLLRRMRPAEI